MNIGAAARASSNFGFADLRVVNPYEVAFREARSAVGAARVLRNAREFDTVARAVADCTLVVGTASAGHREPKHTLRRLEHGARLIRKHTGRVALLFGSEKFGLSNVDLSHCHWLMRIPTRAAHESMNLGQAVAVCLYELVRDARAPSAAGARHTAAASESLERLTAAWSEALDRAGYVNPRTARSTALKLRRMVRRLHLSARDADVWLGMSRQILWKLGEPDD